MNKQRNILLAATMLMSGMLTVTAQNVTTLHMKDGTTRQYPNGWTNTTAISFWEHQPDNTHGATYEYGDGKTAPWDVNACMEKDHQYCVAIYWEDNIPKNFDARHGLCIGTEPAVSLENCERSIETDNTSSSYSPGHLSLIGSFFTETNMEMKYKGNIVYQYISDSEARNWMEMPLEYGKTYYYRTYAKGFFTKNGQRDSTLFYSDVKSFRVPNVMANCLLVPDEIRKDGIVYPSTEALTAFYNRLATVPDSVALGQLWLEWIETADGKQLVDALDKVTHTFDDGVIQFVASIPDAFYEWVVTRKIVVNDTKHIAGLSMNQATMVNDVDGKWGLPNNSYILFEPLNSAVNHYVDFDVHESLGTGVKYKLEITFAPETRYEQADSAALFVPTIVRVSRISPAGKETRIGEESYEVPATEKSTVVIDTFDPAQRLRIQSHVTSRQNREGTYNRIFRVSEIKLTPIRQE